MPQPIQPQSSQPPPPKAASLPPTDRHQIEQEFHEKTSPEFKEEAFAELKKRTSEMFERTFAYFTQGDGRRIPAFKQLLPGNKSNYTEAEYSAALRELIEKVQQSTLHASNPQQRPRPLFTTAELQANSGCKSVSLEALEHKLQSVLYPYLEKSIHDAIHAVIKEASLAAESRARSQPRIQSHRGGQFRIIDGRRVVTGTIVVQGDVYETILFEFSLCNNSTDIWKSIRPFGYDKASGAANLVYAQSLLAKEAENTINEAERFALRGYRCREIGDLNGSIQVGMTSVDNPFSGQGKLEVERHTIRQHTNHITYSQTIDNGRIYHEESRHYARCRDQDTLWIRRHKAQATTNQGSDLSSNQNTLPPPASASQVITLDGHAAVTGILVNERGEILETLLSDGFLNKSALEQTTYATKLGYERATLWQQLSYMNTLLSKEADNTISEVELKALQFYRQHDMTPGLDSWEGLKVVGRKPVVTAERLWDPNKIYPNVSTLVVRLPHHITLGSKQDTNPRTDSSGKITSFMGQRAVVRKIEMNGDSREILLAMGSFNKGIEEISRDAAKLGYRLASRDENLSYLTTLISDHVDGAYSDADTLALTAYMEHNIQDVIGVIDYRFGALSERMGHSSEALEEKRTLFVRSSENNPKNGLFSSFLGIFGGRK